MSNSVYFGGSRSLSAPVPVIGQLVRAALAAGSFVHVGCQSGADQLVISAALAAGGARSLVVFAVAPSLGQCPPWVRAAAAAGARVVLAAGGPASVPLGARYLRRSMAAFSGCSGAVFFAPGAGSLAVARECVRSGLPVSAVQVAQPAPVPSCAGSWQLSVGALPGCWSWSVSQLSLF